MVDVIKHGSGYLVKTCERCGCVFGFSEADTIYNKKKDINVATCPECGHAVEVENEKL